MFRKIITGVVYIIMAIPSLAIESARVAKLEADDKTARVGIVRDPASRVEWNSYNGSLDSQRFSPLAQITKHNISQLGEYCSVKIAEGGSFQAGPIFVDGVIYITSENTTAAINAEDCQILWRDEYRPKNYATYPVNRGVAYLNNTIFRGTTDGHLIALDAKNGNLLWENQVTDTFYGEFLSAAPIAWNGMVFIGTSGGDWGTRGRVMAFDAKTGREIWRFNTIPRGEEIGADTWLKPLTAKTGGGASWTSYTLDIKENEIFIPVANPAPDLLPDYRPGDNLFTNSVVILNATTGDLKWWYQSLKNDPWDYGMTAAPMLYRNKKGMDIAVAGSKDGHLYFIDREMKKAIYKVAITTITNPKEGKPTKDGVIKCPGALGGIGWNGPAFDALNEAVVVGAADWCTNYVIGSDTYEQGRVFMGGTPAMVGDPKGWITSIDASSGDVRWKYKTDAAVIGAVLPTAGGLVFAGDTNNKLYVFDSHSGEVVAHKTLLGSVGGGIISYSLNSRQFIALTVGNVSRASFGGGGAPTLVIMTLSESDNSKNKEPENQLINNIGEKIYSNSCAVCHGKMLEGGVGPSLKGIGSKLNKNEIANSIENPTGTMPKLPLSNKEIEAVINYLLK